MQQLKYNIRNIRLAHENLSSQEEVERALWNESNLNFLYEDIKNRGLEEPLFIDKLNRVLEGNRRLAVYKKLYKEQQAGQLEGVNGDFSVVKCQPVHPDTPQLDIEVWLASIHVGQKSEWPDYNQARLLYKLHNDDGLSFETLAQVTRKSKPIVMKKCDAYELIEKYHKAHPEDKEWSKKFPHFWEFLRKDLQDVKDDEHKVKMFMSWLAQNRFPDSKDVRHLKSIFENPKALRALEKDNVNEALKVLMQIDPTVKSPTFKKIVKLTNVFEAFPTKEFVKTVNDESRIKILREHRTAVNRLIIQIETVKKRDEYKS